MTPVGADLYEALGLARSATQEDVAAAFRRRAHLHPDKHPGDAAAAERFKAITAAHATLSDPEKRAAYDASVAGGVPADYVAATNFTLDLARKVYEVARTVDPRAAAATVADKLTTAEGRGEIEGAWGALRDLGERIFGGPSGPARPAG